MLGGPWFFRLAGALYRVTRGLLDITGGFWRIKRNRSELNRFSRSLESMGSGNLPLTLLAVRTRRDLIAFVIAGAKCHRR